MEGAARLGLCPGLNAPGESSVWASRFQRGPVKSGGLLGLTEATAIPAPSRPCQVRALGLLFQGCH